MFRSSFKQALAEMQILPDKVQPENAEGIAAARINLEGYA
jgi:hypothetical protein